MKPSINLTAAALVVALAALLTAFWRPQAPVQAVPTVDSGCDNTRSVQVTGTAVVNVVPDRVQVVLGVQSNGATPDGVHADNVRAMQSVVNAIKQAGVDAKDIATDFYIVQPVYSDYNSLNISGYRVNNTISVTLRDVKLIDAVVTGALKAGANQVQDVQFYTSELRKYRDQARELAMKAAGEKAQALASAAGAQTGCVLTANENIIASYYGSWMGGRSATSMWMQNVSQNASQGEMPVLEDSLASLGQIAVQAQINASYSLQ
jgi:hypothetical protein